MAEKKRVQTSNFIRNIIAADLEQDRVSGHIVTRFPPEPNGYLHIGHAMSIYLNFGMAQEFAGVCHLRFDDTNPEKESKEYIQAIKKDVTWLGFTWHKDAHFASDYFPQLHVFAYELIGKGLAYVCDLAPEQAKEYRGTLTSPGTNSPYRDRSVAENLDLFERMRAGEFADGSRVLRAKIDMKSPNINLRDPIIYRIRHIQHHQTANAWCIYPMYDFTHGLSDAIEGVTHSLCTLEFEDHRPLYDWFISNVSTDKHPKQYEFSRLELNYTVTSKRKLKMLVDKQLVSGWDDPRMPTLSGMRRRGFSSKALRNFCAATPVTKSKGITDIGRLEASVRDDLDTCAPRTMCVLDPLKVTLTNWSQDTHQVLTLPRHPKDETMGTREVSWGGHLYIDRADFAIEAPPKWKRLALNQSVRLRGGYVITCQQALTDIQGHIIELKCTFDAATLGEKPEGYKANGVIHWVNADDHLEAEVRLYDRLFKQPQPNLDSEAGMAESFNPDSLRTIPKAYLESSLRQAQIGDVFQFEREGYFCMDQDSTGTHLVFNRTITLRDVWGGSH